MTKEADPSESVEPSTDDAPVRRRKLKPQAIAAIILAAVLVAVGGAWLANDLSQRRAVPDLAGTTLQAALDAVAAVDLELDVTASDIIAGLRDENTVVAQQTPAPGEILKAGDAVSIFVEGREVLVPELTGLSLSDARIAVSKAEFTLVHKFGDNQTPDSWLISKQSIRADNRHPAGSEIDVSFEVPEILMPEVLGSEVEMARSDLLGLGLLVVEVGEGTHVASASTTSGELIEPFAKVELVLGFAVADVVGMTFSEAREALSSFPNVTTNGHHSRPITSQSVPAGSFITKDTEIVLTSPGPETVYRIIGNGSSAMITWSAPGSFNIQQDTNASLPWEVRFPTDSGYTNFNAQINDGDSITCQVERNGKIVRELTSTGYFAFISC